ncbi:protein kinase domain protein [Ichthyophthirius multifiliis]|uniref:cGMP-dependent protein kinase n=1 Tax=Ichthyophthirius multifiliis TaxID=5932 RepID=G0QRQ0_ICHMU|nr:protein kinase domain protein [Ichthyophthirius multifiliis]EGR32104.1 protein kinase domain protein [Ichthyophthirius multifiliis]|eukprot:XP_004035590.1 protein kinase domain protein [Ichthyophthirius multifiliis]
MGCSSSIQNVNTVNQRQTEEILGNQIPKQFLGNQQHTHTDHSKDNTHIKKDNHIEEVKKSQQRIKKKFAQKIRASNFNNEVIYENIQKHEREKTKQDQEIILQSLRNHFLFNALTDDELVMVVDSMFYCTNSQDYVFMQGYSASSYFIIEKGDVEILINNEFKKKLSVGEGFGELALLYSALRSASIKCIGKCGFWGIDRTNFRKTVGNFIFIFIFINNYFLIENIVQHNYTSNRQFMESVNFFQSMNAQQKDSIANALINIKYEANQFIVNEGDSADSFYMIKDGTVSVWQSGKIIRKLQKGDSFGEQALYVSSTRAASVKAETQVQLMSLGRQNLVSILGDQIQNIIFNNIIKWGFDKNQLLKQLTKIQIEKVTKQCMFQNHKKEEIIFEKGNVCNKLIVVLEGKLGEFQGNTLAVKGGLFGDQYLKKAQQSQVFKKDIVMQADGVLCVISFENFKKCIGGDIENVIKENANSHEIKMQQQTKANDYSHILLNNLIYIKKLGAGQFGNVYLVANKTSDQLYALKSVSKAQIVQQKIEKYVIQEKNILLASNFNFIMKFIRTFKDDYCVYFLVEYIQGMELFDVIRDMDFLNVQQSQFYIGTLILCLEYLHGKTIIYRDLKPENIMINSNGIMFLIDLGTCKFLNQEKNIGRTFTIIGTPHYMAPEIIQGKGYSYSVDLWSLGVCLYEFMCGGLPYAEDADDPYEIYEQIMKQPLKLPKFIKDRNTIAFISQLLSKRPEIRLGSSFAALKAHPWFDNFSWDDLYNRNIQPPYLPPAKKIIANKEIQDQIKAGKSVIQQIKADQAQLNITYNKEKANIQNWDNEF